MSNPFPTKIQRENADLMTDLALRMRAPGYTANEADCAFVHAIAGNFRDARWNYEHAPTPPADVLVELPEWSGSGNRRTQLAKGVVYTMRVPFRGASFVASLAIVPAGSGSIGGQISPMRGVLAWDGTGGAAGGTFIQSVDYVTSDQWFTFRLGADQADTDVNVLIQPA